jgi:DUF1009 family protein
MGVHEIAQELVAPEGVAGPSQQTCSAVHLLRIVAGTSRWGVDLGQAVVVAGRRAIAAEDIAGTDALLARVQRFASWASPLMEPLAGARQMCQAGSAHACRSAAIGPVTIARARRAGMVSSPSGRRNAIDPTGRLVAAADAAGISV